MKTSTLFMIGLVAGAVAVFMLRAAALEEAPAVPDAPSHEGHAMSTPPPGSAEPAEPAGPAMPPEPTEPATREARLLLRVAPDGSVVFASMRMPDGTEHRVEPGGHAPMGDFPARISGRDEPLTAHLHPHDNAIEITVMDRAGKKVAGDTLRIPAGAAAENRICPVMGNEVQPDVYIDYQGRRIGFCCWGCDDAFLADPSKHLAKVDREIAERGAPAAGPAGAADDGREPENAICPVMGNPVDPRFFTDYKGRRIGFCCDGCDELFKKDPEEYLKKVDAERAARQGTK